MKKFTGCCCFFLYLCLSFGYIIKAGGSQQEVLRSPDLLPIFFEVQLPLKIRHNHTGASKMLLQSQRRKLAKNDHTDNTNAFIVLLTLIRSSLVCLLTTPWLEIFFFHMKNSFRMKGKHSLIWTLTHQIWRYWIVLDSLVGLWTSHTCGVLWWSGLCSRCGESSQTGAPRRTRDPPDLVL